MMGRTPEAWRIILVIEIYNRLPDTLRLRRIDLRSSGRTRGWREPLGITPGAL